MSSRGVNKVILIGNLGQDPETRFFPDGGAVTNASIATSESWRDKQTGEQKERTEWHRVVFMDRGNYKLGQYAGEWLKKGSKVFVEGALRTRKWEDQSGVTHYTTEIIVSEFQQLDSRGDEPQKQPAKQPVSQQAAEAAPQGDFSDFDDDIPF